MLTDQDILAISLRTYFGWDKCRRLGREEYTWADEKAGVSPASTLDFILSKLGVSERTLALGNSVNGDNPSLALGASLFTGRSSDIILCLVA